MTAILTRDDVRERIASGETIVIYSGHVLRLDNWIKFHPGGDKAIYHMVGRDATDEMNAYHSDETRRTFRRFSVGKIEAPWENFLPPIQGGVFEKSTESRRSKSISSSDSSVNSDFSQKGEDSDCEEGHVKLAGEPEVKVAPPIPQEMVFTKDKTFAYKQKEVIKDPEDLLDNYENKNLEKDLNEFPPLDYETQRMLSVKYNELHQKVIDLNLYDCNYWSYFKEFCRISGLLLYSAVFFRIKWLFLSAVCLGLAWQQMTFIVHDAAHISITHNYQFDSFIGMTIASYIGGLSSTWWKRNHNVHHLVTNDPVHDPDIQHLPFFAVSTRLFRNVYSTYYEKYLYFDKFAATMIRVQNYLYYPILSFGRFNLYRLSWSHLIFGDGPTRGKAAWFRYYELVGLSTFAYWFFYVLLYKSIDNGRDRFMYLMVSHITTMIVHVQIVLSHFAMSTSDLGVSESFPSKQIRTTMDVDCPEWFDYIHGGLQFQAIHHLFPRMPRHNFRKAQPYVIQFCKEVGIPYCIYGFTRGNQKVLSKLEEIAHQAKILADCTQKMSVSEFMGEE